MSSAQGPGQAQKISGRVIVAGPAATGKTCLIERFVHDVYAADDPTHGPTLGVDCSKKTLFVDETEVQLFLYDTAGQERFADMSAAYYRCGDVCLLCFDMSDLATFDSTQFWLNKVRDNNPKCKFILVGTKEDLLPADKVQEKMADISAWAEENGMSFFTTSAKTGGLQIKFLFHTVAEKCMMVHREKQKAGAAEAQGRKLGSPFSQPQSRGCC
eukprot:TRINITY_DN6044_c0_g2_i1.p1 TRINITY_DN6044_c0_g2~~TRINITY_DN6044_c0_g2_i1.p1  ORF type:complete len:214 (-),score=46.35 TRINITY_DN6044_c0_g2_i1:373-1014(-)